MEQKKKKKPKKTRNKNRSPREDKRTDRGSLLEADRDLLPLHFNWLIRISGGKLAVGDRGLGDENGT